METKTTVAIPGKPMPEIVLDKLGGGSISMGGAGWKAIVVYRGSHCPLCKETLRGLSALQSQYKEAGVQLIAVSADNSSKAQSLIDEVGFKGDVGMGLTSSQMELLGLYTTAGRNEKGATLHSEPAVFVTDSEGVLVGVTKSNVPFMRLDMELVLNGIKYLKSL